MKKLLIAIATLILGMGILGGCGSTLLPTLPGGGEEPGGGGTAPTTPLEALEEKYSKISEAKTIGRIIEIESGSLLQYRREETMTKAGSGYAVEGTVKRLNDLSAEQPYTESEVSELVKSAEFSVEMQFDELYFKSSKFEGNTFEADIRDGSVGTVLGISEELPAPVKNMHMKMMADDKHVTKIELSYVSESSTVGIVLTFTY